MENLKIEYVPVKDIRPYKNNAKIHTPTQIEQIKESIKEFGMNDPIAVWKDNLIVEGHGRLIACEQMGIDTVPIIRLDHMTEEQRKAYTLVHNKLTVNTGFDFELLDAELAEILDIDMSAFGFMEMEDIDLDISDDDFISDTEITKSKTKTIKCPHCGEEFEA